MSGGPDIERDDIEHDRHLRQALRHAPDADAAPPAALRELILRQAQAKAREGRPAAAATPSVGQRLWDWIGRPRFAGALAGVMVIGFAGLLWRDRPPEEALPPRVAMQAPAAPAPVAEPAPVEQEMKAKTAPAGEAPAPAPAQAQAPRVEKPKPAAPHRAEEAKRRDAAADSRGIVAEETTLQMPGPTAEAPPAAAPAPLPAPAPPAAPRSPEAAADALAQRSRNESRERSVAGKMAAPAPVAAAPEAAAIASFAASGPAIAQLRQQIGSEAARWYWQRPGGPQHPFDNAVSRWLGRLESASHGRWQSLGNVRPAPGTELQLLRDGEVTQRLQLTDDALVWERRDVGETLRAPLDAATLASLRQALEAATP